MVLPPLKEDLYGLSFEDNKPEQYLQHTVLCIKAKHSGANLGISSKTTAGSTLIVSPTRKSSFVTNPIISPGKASVMASLSRPKRLYGSDKRTSFFDLA